MIRSDPVNEFAEDALGKMPSAKLKWFAVLIASTALLVWRSIDFIQEAAADEFKITRIGLAIWDTEAERIELVIIVCSISVVLKAVLSLVRLYRVDAAG